MKTITTSVVISATILALAMVTSAGFSSASAQGIGSSRQERIEERRERRDTRIANLLRPTVG